MSIVISPDQYLEGNGHMYIDLSAQKTVNLHFNDQHEVEIRVVSYRK
jgi:hypothetical protein